jgi:hypothetical protein
MVDIFKWTTGGNVPYRWSSGGDTPSRNLALVCRRWKALLLGTSVFWRKMKINFVPENQSDFHASHLRRRLELSQGALLDVVLDTSAIKGPYSKVLFEILASAGVGRWRSLRLAGDRYQGMPPADVISGLFSGTFTSLKCLYLESTNLFGEDAYRSIYELIALSPPTITLLKTSRSIPIQLRNTHVLGKVGDFEATGYVWDVESRALQLPKFAFLWAGSPSSGRPVTTQ